MENHGLSLPERMRKSKKSSDQPEMDQQTSPQHNRPGSAKLPTGDSAAPATSLAARTESTAPQATGLTQTPATNTGLLSRTGSLQVPLQNTQASSSHTSPMSGPLFMEDMLSTSSEQEICDQEVTTIFCENTPTSPAHTIPSRHGSIATVDYSPASTQGMSTQSNIHKYHNHNHKMLHKVNLLQQTHKPFSSHLLHPSNSHHCYSPQFQAHMLHQCSSISHNLCNLR